MLRFLCLSLVATMFSAGVNGQQEFRLMASISPPYVDASLPEQGLALELVKRSLRKRSMRPGSR